MNPKDIDNYMVEPAFEDEPIEDDDDAFERRRQEAIDSAIEAGDHLLDKRKEDALMDALEGIARTAVLDIDGTNQAS